MGEMASIFELMHIIHAKLTHTSEILQIYIFTEEKIIYLM